MTKFDSIIDEIRTLINADSVRDMRAMTFSGISLWEAFSVSASKIFSKMGSLDVNELIDGFVTNVGPIEFHRDTASDLLRRPTEFHFFSDIAAHPF